MDQGIQVPQEAQNQTTVTAPMPPPVQTNPSDNSGLLQNQGNENNSTQNPSQTPSQTPNPQTGNQNPTQTVPKQSLPPNAPPAVKSAWTGTHIVKGIADVLSPPQFKTVINDDGSSSQKRIPRDRRDIGMSIALAALTGAFKGLGEKGPGHNGRAAAAGFDAVAQQRQEQEKQQREQAQGDFQRKMSTFETNMKLRAGAVQAGMQDRDANEAFSESYAPVVESLDNPEGEAVIKGGSIQNPLPEDELEDIKKNSPFKLTRIPVGKPTPRFGPDGHQVWLDEKTKKVVPDGTPGSHPAWDIRGILVDYNAKIPLSDEKGPKPWVKNIVDHDYAQFIPGASEALLAGKGALGTASVPTVMNMYHLGNLFKTTQDQLDSFTKELNGDKKESDPEYVKPIDLTDALKSGKIDTKSLEAFQKAAGNTAGVNSTLLNTQIDAVVKSNQTLGNKLQALFGPTNLKKYQQKSIAEGEAEKRKLEQGEKPMSEDEATTLQAKAAAGPNATQEEIAKKFDEISTNRVVNKDLKVAEGKESVEQKYQNEQDSRVLRPQAWTMQDATNVSKANNAFEAEEYIRNWNKQHPGQQVNIPSTFPAIWATANHGAEYDNKVFPTRVSKGTNQLDTLHGLTYIQNFMNPNYHASDFTAASKFNTEMSDPKVSPVINAGVATQHMQLLHDAATALQNNPDSLQFLNNIAQQFGIQTGKSAPVVFKAISDFVNDEVGKVATGSGEVLESKRKQLGENLNIKQAINQTDDVLKSYVGLMAGRLNTLDSNSRRMLNRPISIDAEANKVFHKFNPQQTLSWEEKGSNQNQNQNQNTNQAGQDLKSMMTQIKFPNGKPAIFAAWDTANRKAIFTQDGKNWVYENGSPYVPPKQ